jgi:ribosomal protein S18 acetylase RimI-like enzyme
MDSKLAITISDTRDLEFAKTLEDGLDAHEIKIVGEAPRPLQVAAREGDGELIGGIDGFTAWKWLYVRSLWVDEDRRRGGLGTQLLCSAEVEAIARGCRYAHLSTMNFQALEFYSKAGYEVFGELDNKPDPHRWIFLRKRLENGG